MAHSGGCPAAPSIPSSPHQWLHVEYVTKHWAYQAWAK